MINTTHNQSRRHKLTTSRDKMLSMLDGGVRDTARLSGSTDSTHLVTIPLLKALMIIELRSASVLLNRNPVSFQLRPLGGLRRLTVSCQCGSHARRGSGYTPIPDHLTPSIRKRRRQATKYIARLQSARQVAVFSEVQTDLEFEPLPESRFLSSKCVVSGVRPKSCIRLHLDGENLATSG